MSDDTDLQDRVDELEERIEAVDETQRAVRESSIKPRLEDLKGRSDDAQDERAELQAEVEDLRATVAELTATVDALAGLADDQVTTPEKRVADLRQSLIRRARDRDADEARMYWKEVQETFQTLGHGELEPPVCYTAMDDAAEQDGFSLTKTTSREGNRVKAVAVDLAELTDSAAVNQIKTRAEQEGPRTTANEVTKSQTD